MRKIHLSLDDLTVESFNTVGRQEKNAGTVRGHDDSGENSEFSNCASCLMEGCPFDTMTCFGSCRNSQYYPGGPCEPYIDGNC